MSRPVAGSALWLTLGYAPQPGTGDLAKGAGWGVNLAVAERVVRRPAPRTAGVLA